MHKPMHSSKYYSWHHWHAHNPTKNIGANFRNFHHFLFVAQAGATARHRWRSRLDEEMGVRERRGPVLVGATRGMAERTRAWESTGLEEWTGTTKEPQTGTGECCRYRQLFVAPMLPSSARAWGHASLRQVIR